MLINVLLAGTIGIVLGSNFKIFVLGPAIFVASGASAASSLAAGFNAVEIVVDALAILTSLQIGYLIGGIATVQLHTKGRLRSIWGVSRYSSF